MLLPSQDAIAAIVADQDIEASRAMPSMEMIVEVFEPEG